MIDLGASLDATDDYGQKPIHLAAMSNKATVVKTLLKQRPNLVIEQKRQKVALVKLSGLTKLCTILPIEWDRSRDLKYKSSVSVNFTTCNQTYNVSPEKFFLITEL